jgi:hypothetical protein
MTTQLTWAKTDTDWQLCYSDIFSLGYSGMSSPAMMLVLLLPRPLFTQALVRACTCTITIDITHLQSDRSRFKRNVSIYMQRSDPRAIANSRRGSLVLTPRCRCRCCSRLRCWHWCRCRRRCWSRHRCWHWCRCRGCVNMRPCIPSNQVLHPPGAAGVPTPEHDPVQWITKRRHPIIMTDNGIVAANVLLRQCGTDHSSQLIEIQIECGQILFWNIDPVSAHRARPHAPHLGNGTWATTALCTLALR